MFELQILLANVFVPAGVLVFATALDLLQSRRTRSQHVELERAASQASNASGVCSALIASVAAVLSVWLAFAMRNDFVWWSDDYWQRIPLATALVAAGAFITQLLPSRLRLPIGIPVAVVALAYSANLVTPQGESWADVVEPRQLWIGLLIGAPLISFVGLAIVPVRLQGLMLFSWIAAAVAAAFLSAQSFMRVTEPMLAYATCLGITGIYCWLRPRREFALCVALPAVFALGASAAHGQFNSYLGLPNGITFLAMSQTAVAATLVLIMTRVLGERVGSGTVTASENGRKVVSATSRLPIWKAILVVFGVSCCVAAATIVWTGSEAGFSVESADEEW